MLGSNPTKNKVLGKEVYFRYCHEINKVLLLIWFAKKQQSFLKGNYIPTTHEGFLNSSMIFLAKANFMNNIMVQSLKSRHDCLNLQGYAASQFFQSDEYKRLLDQTQQLQLAITKHIHLLTERFKRNNLQIHNLNIVGSSNVSL